MKTFKQFFAEAEADISIKAVGPGMDADLGNVDKDQANLVANYVDKISHGGQDVILVLIKDSQFDTATGGDPKENKYYRVFDYLLYDEKYKIDWQAFKEHQQNRFKENDLIKVFSGTSGAFNLYSDFAEPILSKFVKSNVDSFFKELFVINPAIGGTSVGDGEFVLGVLGNGIKGVTGDVDLVDKQPIDNLKIPGANITLEVGTNNKIIGSSSREKNYMTTARNIITAVRAPLVNKRGQIREADEFFFNNDNQRWQYVTQELGKFGIFKDQNTKWLSDLLKKASSEDYIEYKGKTHLETPEAAGKSLINRIVGGIVLYDYLIGHGDDIIVSIYFSSQSNKQSAKLPPGYTEYDVRWLNVRQLGLAGTINFINDNKWYNFNIDPQATRFTFGT